MNLSAEEAAHALAAVETSRRAMRDVVRSHRGHLQLWLWGVIWIAMAMSAQFRGLAGVRLMPWLSLGGMVLSFIIGLSQSSHVRGPIDRRFLAVLVAIVGFAGVWPLVLGWPADPHAMFAYTALVAMFCYVVAGIWFDVYLLWVGLIISALILVGLFFFPAIFWWWIAVFAGGSLIATGFYVRYAWR